MKKKYTNGLIGKYHNVNMKKLIEFLKTKKLIGSKGPNADMISSYNLTGFIDIIEEIEEIIKEGNEPFPNPFFSHSASMELGGRGQECSHIECRLENINKLARFALMYSDKVVIDSFFNNYTKITRKENLNSSLKSFYEDLVVLFEIKNALSSGMIQFYSFDAKYCPACHVRELLGQQTASKFAKSYKALQLDFLNNTNITVEKHHDNIYGLVCSGPSPYFAHESCKIIDKLPQPIYKRPKILKKIESGSVVNISKTLAREIEFHEGYANKIAHNALYGLMTSKFLNSSFLTENELHLKLLNSMQPDLDIVKKNVLASSYMTSIVPFVEDVNVNNLITLREREKEAFLVYRKALNEAIKEFSNYQRTFTENDAKSLYSDILVPSLAALDQKVKRAKKDLIKKPFRNLTGVVGAISFGLLTGIIPQDISAIASAIGLTKFGSDFIKDAMAMGDKECAIRDHQFYFLWKVKQKVEK